MALWLAGIFPCHGQTGQSANQASDIGMTRLGDDRTNGLGDWIWTQKTLDRQTCQFWKSFEIPKGAVVAHARLRMTVDNDFTLFLDGREVGRGAEWRHLYEKDLTLLLSPGKHVLALKAYNSDAQAGVLFGLQIELEDG